MDVFRLVDANDSFHVLLLHQIDDLTAVESKFGLNPANLKNAAGRHTVATAVSEKPELYQLDDQTVLRQTI